MKKINIPILLLLCSGLLIGIPMLFNMNNNFTTDNIQENEDFSVEDDETEVITLSGTAEEIGKAYGTIYKENIRQNLANFWSQVYNADIPREGVMENIQGEVNILRESSPNIIAEWEAMALAAGVSFDDIAALNLFHEALYSDSEDVDTCTSWMSTGTASLDGKTITHKNCDSDRKYHTVVRVAETGKNTYIAVVSDGNSVRAGMNDKGLVISNNYVDVDLGLTNYFFGTSPNILERKILQDCDSVDEVFPYMEGITRKYGSLYFVADKEKAAVIEFTSDIMTTPEQSIIENDVAARANHFKVLPDSYHRVSISEKDLIQYQVPMDYLTERKGSVTLEDINLLSRYHDDSGSHDGNNLCTDGTVFGATFEVDPTYPGQLNTMWLAMNNPCVSMYTPIHMASSIHARWASDDAWELAQDIRDNNLIPFDSLSSYYADLESQSYLQEEAVRDTCFSYIHSGQSNLATTTLSTFDSEKGDYVWETMTYINENNGAEPQEPDTEPPVQITGLSAVTVSEYAISLSWNANSEADLDHYNVYRNSQKIAETTSNSYTSTGLTPDTTYTYQVSAVDTSDNEGSLSYSVSATTDELDIEAPSQVTGLSAVAISEYAISLSWNANSEADLDHYSIYRNGQKIAETASTSYTSSGLTPDTTYTYQVSAVDTSDNEGTLSNSASATTDELETPILYVSSIDMDYSKRWSYLYLYVVGYRIYTDIAIVDGSGNSVSGASVSIELSIPDGSTVTLSGTTDSNGIISVNTAVGKISGTYTSTIASVSKSGYTYVPSNNIETSENLVI